jgi:hypothetical protein
MFSHLFYSLEDVLTGASKEAVGTVRRKVRTENKQYSFFNFRRPDFPGCHPVQVLIDKDVALPLQMSL